VLDDFLTHSAIAGLPRMHRYKILWQCHQQCIRQCHILQQIPRGTMGSGTLLSMELEVRMRHGKAGTELFLPRLPPRGDKAQDSVDNKETPRDAVGLRTRA